MTGTAAIPITILLMASAFEPKTLTTSSVGSPTLVQRRFQPAVIVTTPRIRGGTRYNKDEDGPTPDDGDGELVHVSCEDEKTTLLTWKNGKITSSGSIEFIAGCSGGSGS